MGTTTDGYKLRLFCVGFTKRRQNQVKKTTYAQTTQIRAIRKKMMDIMKREVTNTDVRGVVTKLFQTPWHPTSPRLPLQPTHFTKSMYKRSRFSRSQDSTFLSFWKCTVKPARSSQRKTVNK